MAFFKAEKMKQRLQSLSPRGLSCSSAASTSVVAFSSGRAIDRLHSPHLRDPHRSSMKKLKNKKTTVPPPQPQPTSPASSSRFLLNSSRLQLQQSDDVVTILDTPPSFIEQDDLFAPVITEQTASSSSILIDGISKSKAAMTMARSCSTRSQHQVVVLKVSLHCKGCAGKVKKHISKMQGVTSFDIDIATKKVTVMGDVTPLGVLNCVSKVKSAQFWPASSFSSPPRASASF
ncbi:hypothetical protein EJB05_19021 [Eragrostis curvula]|uniref:HMA domain-containing protein n=1 Tax=Eragrostis curvula TaxID=38414 RepID=A0A5J9VNN4_9POAL|nr:hypothetical protein EJB05_19021 [Eragrostis curvula]